MKTNWSTFNYNYAAVETTLLSAIDFLTNDTVNLIICDDDRINCNFYTPVSRRSILCDWVWRAGVHTGFRTMTLVLYIWSLPNLATWFPYGRGRTLFILGSLPFYRLIIYIDVRILWCTHFLLKDNFVFYTMNQINISSLALSTISETSVRVQV